MYLGQLPVLKVGGVWGVGAMGKVGMTIERVARKIYLYFVGASVPFPPCCLGHFCFVLFATCPMLLSF